MNEESLFVAVLDQPTPAERAAYLDRVCADDPDLRRRVERLLAAEHDPGILDRPKAVPLSGMFRIEAPLAADQVFAGRFTLREKLGEGGMGEVWVADQSEPVRRRVALKVIRPGHGSAHRLARFDQERQTLALMNHPNIARVFDAGVADGGRPFFVMELIDGAPLTKYCDAGRLPLRDRLDLFVQVCQAVQHAHQKGVIHRDLKPSNILVAEVDGRPVPKVIDFGIAKATGGDIAGPAVSTEIGMLVGTLEYMSPEQAELNNPDIDTRCDVHALGVVLYELLTGTVPVSRDRLRAAPFDEMLRIIKEVEPPRPSQRLAEVRSAERGLRNEGPPTPHSALRIPRLQELDWIVMKCLDKDRGRRYETANGLAMDVQRYLADESVLAVAPSAGYRLRKFARRHRTGLAFATVVVLGLVATVVTLSLALVAVDRERREKETALLKEGKRRQLARAALNAMSSKIVEHWLGRQPVLTAEHRAFVEQIVRHYEAFAADSGEDEESRADVAAACERIGYLQSRLGQDAAAEAASARSRDLYAALAAEFPDAAAYRVGLARAHLRVATGHRLAARNDQARASLEESLPELRTPAAAADPRARDVLAMSLLEYGMVLKNLGRPADAVAAYREAVVVAEGLAAADPGNPNYRFHLAGAHAGHGTMLLRQKQPATADFSRAVELLERLVADSPRDPEYRDWLATQRDHLAVALRVSNPRGPVEELLLGARKLRRELVEEFPTVRDYQIGLAGTLNNLGVHYRTDRPALAEGAFAEAVGITRRMADQNPAAADAQDFAAGGMCNLARMRLDEKDFAGARRLLEDALSYHRAARASAPFNPTYRASYRSNRWVMCNALLGLRDHAGAAAAAIEFRAVATDPGRDGYIAAVFLADCVRLAAGDQVLPAVLRHALRAAYGKAAVAALAATVEGKAKEVSGIAGDPRLDPLRSRPDFQALVPGQRAK